MRWGLTLGSVEDLGGSGITDVDVDSPAGCASGTEVLRTATLCERETSTSTTTSPGGPQRSRGIPGSIRRGEDHSWK
jgi:hypothetical protein